MLPLSPSSSLTAVILYALCLTSINIPEVYRYESVIIEVESVCWSKVPSTWYSMRD